MKDFFEIILSAFAVFGAYCAAGVLRSLFGRVLRFFGTLKAGRRDRLRG